MNNIWFRLLFAALVFSVNTAEGQKLHRFSVSHTVDYAMKNATAIQNALLDIKIQEQTNREITAMAYPQLNTSLTYNQYIELPTSLVPAEFGGGTPGTFIPIQFGTKYNVTGGIDFNQILFDGQVFVGLQARRATLEFSARQAEVTMEMVKVNIYKLYYQLVVGQKQIGSIDANIERFEKLLKDTREIYKNGFAEKLDVDKVSVQLSNLKTEKAKVQSQLDAGNAALKFLINMPQPDTLVLTDSLKDEQLREIILADSVDYENIKEYQLFSAGRRLASYNVKRYKLSGLPTLALFANQGWNAQRTTFDFFKEGGNWFPVTVAGLQMQFNIFQGSLRKSRLEKARLELKKMENNMAQVKESIDNNISQATFRINAAIATVETQEMNMRLAEDVYRATKLKYEQGLGSQQEIYAAQTELKMAQNNYFGALYDAVIAGVDYRKAIGRL